MDLSTCRHSAAHVTAAALFETYPDVEIGEVCATPMGFSCTCFFPHPISPELHFQIEQRMNQIIREDREITSREMIAFSAKEYFKSLGNQTCATQLEGVEGLVQVIQIGSYSGFGLGEEKLNERTGEIPSSFKLFPCTDLGERELKVEGVLFETKDEIKEFFKKWKAYSKTCHQAIGERERFWTFVDGQLIWLPRGLELKRKILSLFRSSFSGEAMEVLVPQGLDFGKVLEKEGGEGLFQVIETEPETRESLLECEEGTELQLIFFLENGISFLQLLGKTLNMLGFNYWMNLTGPGKKDRRWKVLGLEQLPCSYQFDNGKETVEVDFLVEDGIGRKWSAACLEMGEFPILKVKVERNVALLVETQSPVQWEVGKG